MLTRNFRIFRGRANTFINLHKIVMQMVTTQPLSQVCESARKSPKPDNLKWWTASYLKYVPNLFVLLSNKYGVWYKYGNFINNRYICTYFSAVSSIYLSRNLGLSAFSSVEFKSNAVKAAYSYPFKGKWYYQLHIFQTQSPIFSSSLKKIQY